MNSSHANDANVIDRLVNLVGEGTLPLQRCRVNADYSDGI